MKKILLSLIPITITQKILTYKLGYRLLTQKDYYLHEVGYLNSFFKKTPIDRNGDFIPWMNYGIINLLKKRLNKELSLFEFGSGFSSIFYAKKSKHIVSIENNKDWKKEVEKLYQKNDVKNADLIFEEVGEDYINAIKKHRENELFDIVIVDGRERVKCAKASLPYLSEKGILILDDSSRERYNEVFIFYKEKGYKEITFCGIKPGGYKNDCTTIFYKENNCMNI